MPQCKICGIANLIWREKRIKVGTPDEKFIWTMHDPLRPGSNKFAYQTSEHFCSWKAVKHMDKKDRPFYWRNL